MVRALKLETSGSGTYFNLSQGDFVTPDVVDVQPAIVGIERPKEQASKLVNSVSASTRHTAGYIQTP
jgi:hypothetical protein